MRLAFQKFGFKAVQGVFVFSGCSGFSRVFCPAVGWFLPRDKTGFVCLFVLVVVKL